MTKIPSVEERFTANYLDGDKIQDGQMLSSRECLEAITAERTALLTELREWAISKLEETHVEEDGVPVDTYGYPETHNKPLLDLQAHLDELIKSNSV